MTSRAPADYPRSCGEVPGAKTFGQHSFDHVGELADSCQLLSAAVSCEPRFKLNRGSEPDRNRGLALTSDGSCNYALPP